MRANRVGCRNDDRSGFGERPTDLGLPLRRRTSREDVKWVFAKVYRRLGPILRLEG